MSPRLHRVIRTLSFLSWRSAAIGLALLLVVPSLPLLSGFESPTWDASSFFAPNWMLVADHAREGRFLLWNPYVEAGSPDGAQPEYGAFSPLTVGVGALLGGTLAGFVVYTLTLWLLAALGMLGLARHLGAPPWAGFVVACGWAFSGTFTGHFQHTSWLCAYAVIPWVVWRVDAALLDRRFSPAIQAGALLGLAGLSGYPTVVIQTGVLAALWAAGRALTGRDVAGESGLSRARVTRHAAAVVLVGVVAVMVVAPSWVAFLAESRGYTTRSGGLAREIVIHQNALNPGSLSTFASPYLHVVAALWAPARWAPTDGSSLGFYSGAAIVALAVFALVSRRRELWIWWLLGIAAFFLATATDALPFRGPLYDLFPWERVARHGAQRKDFALFLVAVLASHGIARPCGGRAAAESRPGRRLFAKCAVAAAAAALLCGAAAWAFLASPGPRPAFAVMHFALAWGGLLTAAALSGSSRQRLRRLAPGALVLVALVDAAGTVRLSRVLMVDRGRGAEIWARIARERNASLDLARSGAAREPASPSWTWPKPNNQNVPLRIPVFASYASMPNDARVATAGRRLLSAIALGREKVWFATAAIEAEPGREGWRQLVKASRDAGAAVLVVQPPGTMTGGRGRREMRRPAEEPRSGAAAAARALRPVPATVIRYRTDEVVLSVNAPSDGWILFNDRWARGWRGSVDGRAVPVLGGNFIFRAVRVSAGARTIRFVYRPFGYPWLIVLSWGILFAVAAGTLQRSRREAARGAEQAERAGSR